MRNYLVLVAGLLLSTCLPMDAQTPTAQFILAPATPRPIVMLLRAPRARLLLVVPLVESPRSPRKPLPNPAFRLAVADGYAPSPESRLQIEAVRTPFRRETTVPIVRLSRGLELDGFESTIQYQSAQFPSSRSGIIFRDLILPAHDQAAVASSAGLYGIGLRYTFGRDAGAKKSFQIWK
jgi:hypothetical protein